MLTFTPAKKGNESEEKLDLVASDPAQGERRFKDEHETRPLRVIDRKSRCCTSRTRRAGSTSSSSRRCPRPPRRAKLPARQRRPQTLMPGSRRPPFLPAYSRPRDKFFGYDLLILGDVPAVVPRHASRWTWIRDFVRARAAAWSSSPAGSTCRPSYRQHAAGRGAAGRVPADEVRQPTPRPGRKRIRPLLTDAGERSDMLALADTPEDNVKTWKSLPGFYWHYPVTKLRPGARRRCWCTHGELPGDSSRCR